MPRRRTLVQTFALVPVLALGACGFRLRQAPQMAFERLFLDATAASALGGELRRALAEVPGLALRTAAAERADSDAILEVSRETREQVAVGLNISGQVREYELRLTLVFRLQTPKGRILIADTELQQRRELSYTETTALAKEAEQALLFASMQRDLARQVVQRLAAVRLS
ncbi:LPS-assembly lipoprotein [Tibeticola sediminis]|jgi:LPS-assembly lipoprotein|uniref:LPS-assembly lipoprotein LptE n=1 Tax=Tibeticola sediminis TaxID=1917811 RepID=A0A3N4UHX5_9BURK|nr:LPS assembly lipoprotein LptE [Tibeticola sediminis]RPE66819.1 LPS-assembly lipoprotein [Tibeticola sediminis]